VWSGKEIFVFEDFNASLTIFGVEIFKLWNGKVLNGGADNLNQRGKIAKVP